MYQFLFFLARLALHALALLLGVSLVGLVGHLFLDNVLGLIVSATTLHNLLDGVFNLELKQEVIVIRRMGLPLGGRDDLFWRLGYFDHAIVVLKLGIDRMNVVVEIVEFLSSGAKNWAFWDLHLAEKRELQKININLL
jgi:hypothetical protein